MHGSCGFPISSALNGSRMVMSSLDATPMASVSLSRLKCAAPRAGGSPSNGPNLTARRRRKSRANGDACSIRLDSILMASALGSPSAMVTRSTRSGRRRPSAPQRCSQSGLAIYWSIALAFTRPADLQTANTITRSDTHDSNMLRACLAVRVAGRDVTSCPTAGDAPYTRWSLALPSKLMNIAQVLILCGHPPSAHSSCSRSIQENTPPLPIPGQRECACVCVCDDGDVYGGRT
jgi:hypothetical protein